jgi:hypothetical protein
VIVETEPPEQVVVTKDSVTGTGVVTTQPPGSVVVIVVCKADDPQMTCPSYNWEHSRIDDEYALAE